MGVAYSAVARMASFGLGCAAVKLELNPHIRRVLCSKTGAVVDADFSRPLGLHAGNPITFEYDLAEISRQALLPPHIAANAPGIWRYSPLLPVIGVSDGYAGDVGQTPLALHERLSEELGVELYVKTEGGNPSGSFKDRGLSVGVALGVALGARRFCLPTQGNAGVAASLFSVRAGIETALVYMPEQHRDSIYCRAAKAFGAEVRFHGSNIAEAGKRMRSDVADELADGRYVDISTFFEPGRLEGKKTMGFEIVEALGRGRLPHHIFYPTGGGTGLVGIWKAFQELRGLGELPPDGALPRMVAVQSTGCAPVVRSFEAGHDHVEPVVSQGTVADGLDVPGAIMGHDIMRVLRESNGGAIAVSDADIIRDQAHLCKAGVSSCFEGGATLAALRKSLDSGAVKPGDRVVLLITAGLPVALGAANSAARGLQASAEV
jgi:threonine synthase